MLSSFLHYRYQFRATERWHRFTPSEWFMTWHIIYYLASIKEAWYEKLLIFLVFKSLAKEYKVAMNFLYGSRARLKLFFVEFTQCFVLVHQWNCLANFVVYMSWGRSCTKKFFGLFSALPHFHYILVRS